MPAPGFARQSVPVTMSRATAKIVRDFDGYGYIDWADTLKANGKDPELMKNGIAKKHRDLKVLSYKITANDTVKGTSQETIEMDVSSQAIDAGGELLLNPFVLFEYTKNPFNASERKFPVDFTTPRDFTSTVAVRLPPGFGTLELPPSEKLSIPNGSASFTYQSSASSNAIQFRIILKLSKAVYTEAEYLELKQFFSHVVKKLQSPIRLSKT